jgi:hypothetical protein
MREGGRAAPTLGKPARTRALLAPLSRLAMVVSSPAIIGVTALRLRPGFAGRLPCQPYAVLSVHSQWNSRPYAVLVSRLSTIRRRNDGSRGACCRSGSSSRFPICVHLRHLRLAAFRSSGFRFHPSSLILPPFPVGRWALDVRRSLHFFRFQVSSLILLSALRSPSPFPAPGAGCSHPVPCTGC